MGKLLTLTGTGPLGTQGSCRPPGYKKPLRFAVGDPTEVEDAAADVLLQVSSDDFIPYKEKDAKKVKETKQAEADEKNAAAAAKEEAKRNLGKAADKRPTVGPSTRAG